MGTVSIATCICPHARARVHPLSGSVQIAGVRAVRRAARTRRRAPHRRRRARDPSGGGSPSQPRSALPRARKRRPPRPIERERRSAGEIGRRERRAQALLGGGRCGRRARGDGRNVEAVGEPGDLGVGMDAPRGRRARHRGRERCRARRTPCRERGRVVAAGLGVVRDPLEPRIALVRRAAASGSAPRRRRAREDRLASGRRARAQRRRRRRHDGPRCARARPRDHESDQRDERDRRRGARPLSLEVALPEDDGAQREQHRRVEERVQPRAADVTESGTARPARGAAAAPARRCSGSGRPSRARCPSCGPSRPKTRAGMFAERVGRATDQEHHRR